MFIENEQKLCSMFGIKLAATVNPLLSVSSTLFLPPPPYFLPLSRKPRMADPISIITNLGQAAWKLKGLNDQASLQIVIFGTLS